MKKITGVASKVGVGLVVIIFIIFGLKGCVVTVWKAPSQATTYSITGDDGRSLYMIFMPEHKTYIAYIDEQRKSVEVSLTKMLGTYGTHYFWRLWSLEGPGQAEGLFGLRIYPKGAKPVVMETTVLDKYIQGDGTQVLPKKGDRTHPVLLFSENSVRFEGMWLIKESTSTELLSELSQYVSSSIE